MSTFRTIAVTAASLAVSVVVYGVIGSVLWFALGFFEEPFANVAECHAVWFVLGVLAGLVHYSNAVGECGGPSRRTGALVIAASAAALCALAAVCGRVWWRHGGRSDGFVPADRWPTATFFAAMTVTMAAAWCGRFGATEANADGCSLARGS